MLNLDRKLAVLPVYCFEHILHKKECTTLLERHFKLSGLTQYYLWVMKDLKVSVDTTCLPILHLESFAKNIGKIAPAKKKLQPQAKQ